MRDIAAMRDAKAGAQRRLPPSRLLIMFGISPSCRHSSTPRFFDSSFIEFSLSAFTPFSRATYHPMPRRAAPFLSYAAAIIAIHCHRLLRSLITPIIIAEGSDAA
jgi:hypothetical protein